MPLSSPLDKFINQAADRLEELQRDLDQAISERTPHDYGILKMERDEARARLTTFEPTIRNLTKERNEARAEVERLKTELHDTIDSYKLNNLQPKTTRPEPSRLEIAAMAMQGMLASGNAIMDIPNTACEYADTLIAAREGK